MASSALQSEKENLDPCSADAFQAEFEKLWLGSSLDVMESINWHMLFEKLQPPIREQIGTIYPSPQVKD